MCEEAGAHIGKLFQREPAGDGALVQHVPPRQNLAGQARRSEPAGGRVAVGDEEQAPSFASSRKSRTALLRALYGRPLPYSTPGLRHADQRRGCGLLERVDDHSQRPERVPHAEGHAQDAEHGGDALEVAGYGAAGYDEAECCGE